MRSVCLALLLVVTGCGGALTYKIASSQKAPGADATIKADISKDQHLTHLSIAAMHLAPPERVTNGTRIFIIWTRKGNDAQWERVGNLKYDASSREGSFEGTVPEINFDLQVTTEKDDGAVSPSTDMVFTQHVGPG